MLGAFTAIVNLPATLRFIERLGLDMILAPARYFCSTQDSRLLERIYQADLAKSPTNRAAGSPRSNMIALRHMIELMHGETTLRPQS